MTTIYCSKCNNRPFKYRCDYCAAVICKNCYADGHGCVDSLEIENFIKLDLESKKESPKTYEIVQEPVKLLQEHFHAETELMGNFYMNQCKRLEEKIKDLEESLKESKQRNIEIEQKYLSDVNALQQAQNDEFVKIVNERDKLFYQRIEELEKLNKELSEKLAKPASPRVSFNMPAPVPAPAPVLKKSVPARFPAKKKV